MTLAVFLALVTTLAGGASCVLAIGGLRRMDNARARRYTTWSMWLSAAFLPLITIAAAVGAEWTTGPGSKASYLARGISDGMNAGLLNIPIGLTSVVVWVIARKRDAANRRDKAQPPGHP